MAKLNTKFTDTLREYVIMTIGLCIYSLGWSAFTLQAKVVGGGVSGIASAIYYASNIPVEYSYISINIGLILLALYFLGTNFGAKTIYSIATISLLLRIWNSLITQPLIDDPFMETVLGAAISGIGIGIVFTQGGSTGGSDIVGMIVNKYYNISPAKVVLMCDALIVGSSFFIFYAQDPDVYKSISKILYGFVSVGVISWCIDFVLIGRKQSVQIMIFSKEYIKLADTISEELNRGVTILEGTGWHSKQQVKIVLTIVKQNQVSLVNKIVKQIDPAAFITHGSVMSVYGQGFEKMK